jgi:hypothetical protein
MKTLMAIFATIVLLNLTPAGGNKYYSGKMLASTNNTLNKPPSGKSDPILLHMLLWQEL